MTWADDTAAVSPLSAHLEWPSAEDEEVESRDGVPEVGGFFLGQLRDDQAAGVWEDEHPGGDSDRPADPPDDASDFEGFELPAWTGGADLDQALDEDAPHRNLVATHGPELPAAATSPTDDHDEWAGSSAADDLTSAATRPVLLAGGAETEAVAATRLARVSRSRIVIVAAVVVALIGGTAVYVGTRAKAEDQRRRRSTSKSLDRQSALTAGTTATTAGSLDAAPDLEPAPASNPAPGSAAPASRQGTSRGTGSTQSGAPATGSTVATSPSPPANRGPNASPPPPPDPAPNPICRITPDLCP